MRDTIMFLRPVTSDDNPDDLVTLEYLRVVGFTRDTMIMEQRMADSSWQRFEIEHPLLTLQRMKKESIDHAIQEQEATEVHARAAS